jgi:hypothetical protein
LQRPSPSFAGTGRRCRRSLVAGPDVWNSNAALAASPIRRRDWTRAKNPDIRLRAFGRAEVADKPGHFGVSTVCRPPGRASP